MAVGSGEALQEALVQWFCSQADLKCFFAFCFSFFLSKELAEVTQERSTLPGPAELAAEHHGPF